MILGIFHHSNTLAVEGVPQLDGLVEGGAGDPLPVGAERHAVDALHVACARRGVNSQTKNLPQQVTWKNSEGHGSGATP